MYLRPGVVSYHTATKQVHHNAPTIEDSVAGVALKQQEQSWTLGIANRDVVQIGEEFAIVHKGQTLISTDIFDADKGDPIYIKTSDNTLYNAAGSGKVPFGRCIAVAGDNRGTPTGYFVCDMDARDTL
jgi:hypothetical protein